MLPVIERRAEMHKYASAERHAPVQIAAGVKSGGQQLVVGVLVIMDMSPDFTVAEIDKAGAYNTQSRAVTVEWLMANPASITENARVI